MLVDYETKKQDEEADLESNEEADLESNETKIDLFNSTGLTCVHRINL